MISNKAKVRLFLFAGSGITLIAVAAFLFLVNIKEPKEYTAIPYEVLMILVIMAIISLALFFAMGPVFDIDGKLQSFNIKAMLMTVLIIIQVAFFFEIISVRNQILNYQIYEGIRSDITAADGTSKDELDSVLAGFCTETIKRVSVLDENGIVIYSSHPETIGKSMEDSPYTYGFGKNCVIRFVVEKDYIFLQLRALILNLLTVLVTSLFLSSESILLMVRMASRKLEESIKEETAVENKDEMITPLYFIRQISFVFYISSRLSYAFIPTMAITLPSPFPSLSTNLAASIPQMAELFLTCLAIFVTTMILEKKGWKLPYLSGLLMVAAGTLLSAFSPDLLIFILARAVVGLGYGFCWMTLRNLSLFGKNNEQQLLGFALLNAGIYAGINCGTSLGAILADIFGFKTVFIISAVLTLFTSTMIIRMENAIPAEHINDKEVVLLKQPKYRFLGVGAAVIFVVLMIAPTCISASYISYYMPLYFSSMGKNVTDVGRAQLLYGMAIVYAGPMLSKFVAVFKERGLASINVVYNLMIALSLFLPGIVPGIILPFAGAAIMGMGDSVGFGAQNNYFLSLPMVKRLGSSKSLSLLSFVKKMLEMLGPLVFASFISLGFQTGVKTMAACIFVMTMTFMVFVFVTNNIMRIRKIKYEN